MNITGTDTSVARIGFHAIIYAETGYKPSFDYFALPTMRATVDRRQHLTPVARKSNSSILTPPQEVEMQDELRSFTLESIVGVFFGDYASPELMEEVKRYLPTITSGLFSFPVRFPWPLDNIPFFAYGKSMDAREAFSGTVRRVLDERRAVLAEGGGGGNSTGGKSAGVFDSLIEIQQREKGSERGQEGAFDDDFIVDNVRVSHLWLVAWRCCHFCSDDRVFLEGCRSK